MGLGKTVQALAYLNYHPEAAPVLFLVKSGIKFQFFKEILRWLGPKYIPQVLETGRDSFLPGLNAYIMSYDLVRRFKKDEIPKFKTVILDECQQIKNPDSSRTRGVRNICREAENILPLSGTPWKNRGSEFFTVLNMLDPARFPKYSYFVDRWVKIYYHGNRAKEGGIENPEEFREYISDLVIRRERKEVLKELPLINRNLYFYELDNITQESYNEETEKFVEWYNSAVIGGEDEGGEFQQNMLAKLQRMRHITGLAKIPATVDFVKEHIEETGRKIIVGVHHKDVGEILVDKFKSELPNVPVLTIVSSMSSQERFATQERFNSTDCCILIASTLAAGEGLNLQTCSDMVQHERQWNPANEQQFEDRICRIGQKANQLSATYTTASGTVDEFMATLVESKRMAFHEVMNTGDMQGWNINEGDMVKELAKAIVNNYNKGKRK